MLTLNDVVKMRSKSTRWDVEKHEIETQEFICSMCAPRHKVIYRINFDHHVIWLCEACLEEVDVVSVDEKSIKDLHNQMQKFKSRIKRAKRMGSLK